MNYLRKTWLTLTGLCVVLCLTVALSGCSKATEKEDPKTENISATESSLNRSEPTFPSDIKLTEYPNNYCSLYYPSEYKDIVSTEEKDKSVLFYAKIKGIKKLLFTVYFDSNAGHRLGTLKTKDGDVSVSIENPQATEEKKWTKKETAQFEKMQEEVNSLLDALWAEEGFTPDGN